MTARNLISSMGCISNLKGYNLLVEMIDTKYPESFTLNDMYEDIGKKHKLEAITVKRRIGYTISVLDNNLRALPEVYEQYFGPRVPNTSLSTGLVVMRLKQVIQEEVTSVES